MAISTSRVFYIGCLFVTLFIAAIVRLFFVQILNSHFYQHLGKQQYSIAIVETPPRALIYDRHNIPLALNKEALSVFITPRTLHEKEATIKFLKKHFPQAHQRLLTHQNAHFMYVKRRLVQEEIDLITTSGNSDLQLLREQSRFYSCPSLGNTIGFTDTDNNGIAGLELLHNKQLSGKPTKFHLEKDARSTQSYFIKEATTMGHEGAPITLTIDRNIQFMAASLLNEHMRTWHAQEGATIIMNPVTGEILAIASYPDFDPNAPIPAAIDSIKNKIITNTYEPGSVIKPFTMLAGLAERIITPDEIIDCETTRETIINGVKITTWKEHGLLSCTDILHFSNNIGTAKIALRLGTKLYDHLKNCGFSSPTGIDFIGEQKGFITAPAQWSKASPLSLSFGYEVTVTLLQLARAFAMIANDGILVTPHLLINKPSVAERRYAPEVITTLRSMLRAQPSTDGSPTAYIEGYEVFGKTGSAFPATAGGYDKSKSIYTFAGCIASGNYKRVMVTMIKAPEQESGRHVYASSVAMPLFKDIAQRLLVIEKIPPMIDKKSA